MADNRNDHSRSKKIALGGMFAALSAVMMLAGGIIPIATFMAPMLAGICLIPLETEFGARFAFVGYGAVGILAFFMSPDREATLFFLFLLGYYPILHPQLVKIKNKVLRYIAKFLLFNVATAAVYAVMVIVLSSPELVAELSGRVPWFWLVLLGVGNVTFVLYDNVIDKLKIIYRYRIRNRFIK